MDASHPRAPLRPSPEAQALGPRGPRTEGGAARAPPRPSAGWSRRGSSQSGAFREAEGGVRGRGRARRGSGRGSRRRARLAAVGGAGTGEGGVRGGGGGRRRRAGPAKEWAGRAEVGGAGRCLWWWAGRARRQAAHLLGRPGIRASAEPAPQRAGRGARRAGAGREAAAAPCAGEEPGAGRRPAGGGWGPRRGVPERRRRKRQRRLSSLGAWVRGGSGSARGVSGRPGCLPPRPPPPRLGGRWRWADGNPNDGLQTRLHLYHGRYGGRAARVPALAARGA